MANAMVTKGSGVQLARNVSVTATTAGPSAISDALSRMAKSAAESALAMTSGSVCVTQGTS